MNNYAHPHGNVFYRKMAHPRPKISHGQGIYLYDVSGKRYLDGSGGPLVVNVGHGRSEIVQAMAEQAEKAAYVHAIMFTSDALEQYSAELAPLVPMDNPRFFFRNLVHRRAQEFLVVQSDAGNQGPGTGYHIGGIQPTSHAGFQDGPGHLFLFE